MFVYTVVWQVLVGRVRWNVRIGRLKIMQRDKDDGRGVTVREDLVSMSYGGPVAEESAVAVERRRWQR